MAVRDTIVLNSRESTVDKTHDVIGTQSLHLWYVYKARVT